MFTCELSAFDCKLSEHVWDWEYGVSGLSKSKQSRMQARGRIAGGALSAERPRRPDPLTPTANCFAPTKAAGPTPDDQEQIRAIDHIVQILREGGYSCELLPDSLPDKRQ